MDWKPFISVVLLSGWALGGEARGGEVDFRKGLEELAKLGGLVEMGGAKWQAGAGGAREEMGMHGMDYERSRGLKGTGWQIAGQPGVLEFGKLTASAGAEGGAEGGAEESPAKEESLAKADAATLTALLRDPQQRFSERLEGGGQDELVGRSLLFAVQLHAAGETAAANELAAALFALTADKALVVNAAVALMAADEFQRVSEKFFSNYNWGEYLSGLKKLHGKYPRGWLDAPAVGLLIARVEKRVAGAEVAAPSVPGVELKPAAQAALQQLLVAPTKPELSDEALAKMFDMNLADIPASQRSRYLAMMRSQMENPSSGSEGLWLLEEPGEDDEPAPGMPAGPLEELMAMKMDGLLALAAVTTDDTLIPLPSTPDYYYSGSGGDPQERYDRLMRPTSRGELAIRLLDAVVPGGRDEIDPEGLRDEAIEFWKNHRTRSNVELASLYLEEGNSVQIQRASSYLATCSDPAAHAVFEKAALAADPLEFTSHVEEYLSVRGPAAVEFYKAFAKLVREALAGVDQTDRYEAQQAERLEAQLGSMAVQVGAVSIADLIEAALKAPAKEQDGNSVIGQLGRTIQSVPLSECLQAFAAKAGNATPQQLLEIYYLLIESSYSGAMNSDEDDTAETQPLAKEIIDLWGPLVADQREIPGESDIASALQRFGCETLGDSASFVLEQIAFPQTLRSLSQLNEVSGSPTAGVGVLRERTRAMIAGTEPPAWPSSENVPAERVKQLESQLGGLKAAEVAGFVGGLKLDERLALAQIIDGYDEDHPAPAGVHEARSQVAGTATKFNWFPSDPALLEKLGIANGFVVSPESLEKLMARFAGDPKGFSRTVLVFSPAPLGLGCIANAARVEDSKSPAFRRFEMEELVDLTAEQPDAEAAICIRLMQGSASWLVRAGKLESGPDVEPFMEVVKQLAEASQLTRMPFYLQILSREDLEKFNQ